jgi:tetratricopeptide (TPR) repeat protein
VADSDSSDIETYLRLGQSYLKMNVKGKIPVLDKAIRQDSTEALLFRFRGGLNLMEGFFPEAEKDLAQAAALGDTSVFTLRHLGLSQYYQSRYEQALESFSMTVRLDSLDAEAWYYLGFCHKWNQDIPRAIECMNRALSVAIPPFTGGIYSGLGQMYSLSRDFDNAIYNYEKALEFNPTDPLPYAEIGLLIEESFGDREKAKENYERFLAEYSGNDINIVLYVKSRIEAINEKLFMEGKLKKD